MTVEVERALPTDADEVIRIRQEAEEWLASEWHVVRRGFGLCAALRLLCSDASLWRADDCFAAYVHGMMVDRTHAGQGLGVAMLRWAEEQARLASAPFLRLDCVESNARLRAYYEGQGFTVVGRRDFDGPWSSVVLLQKPVLRRR